MSKFSFKTLPGLRLLTNGQIRQIHEDALDILEHVGVCFECDQALEILTASGCSVDKESHVVKFPPALVRKSIEAAPERFKLYDREGNVYTELGGDKVHFAPCSTPASILTRDNREVRPSTIEDMKLIVKVTDSLSQIDLVATSVVCSEIPVEMGDTYLYYLIMKGTPKPFIGGAIDIPGVRRSHDLIKSLFGSDRAVREKPYCIFDICPSPPLKWSRVTSRNIIDCAGFGFPVETISLPLSGTGSPVTQAGSILQHTVESLSGLVLTQVINPGNPYVYGGAPVIFDMRTTTTPMSAMDAVMISCGYALMGKYYGLPTHTYAAQTDSKIVDFQAGFETGMSALLASQAGFDVVSGVGGLNYVTDFSVEKLLMDAEIINLVKRYRKGITVTQDTLAKDLIARTGPGGDFLQSSHTRRWFRQEHHMPGPIIDRLDRATWEANGRVEIFDRAKIELEKVKRHPGHPLDQRRSLALDWAMVTVARDAGVDPVTIPLAS